MEKLPIVRLVPWQSLWYNTAAMKNDHYEIERKFLIRRPDRQWLEKHAAGSKITQTYLTSLQGGSARVRRREYADHVSYTHTVKQKVNELRRIETEREISREEYEELLTQADPERHSIEKERWVLLFQNQAFEIDVFPFWKDRAFLEIELEDEGQSFPWPERIVPIREVTGDRRYSNASLALEIPQEEIQQNESK